MTEKKRTIDTKLADNMTQEQLLAMPEDQYMNDQQLAYFKKLLLEIQEKMLSNAKNFTKHFQDKEGDHVADLSDQATNEENNNLQVKAINREANLLIKIEKSLRAIESREYGFCRVSGDPIGLPRLLIRPTAEFTTEIQDGKEKKQKHYADD